MKHRAIGIALIVLSGLAAGANAATLTQFRWYNTTAGNLVNADNVAIAAGGATVLTYLSPDNTINFNPDALMTASYGNDFFYKALGNGFAGRLTTTYMTEVDSPDYRGYFTYAIVLDMLYSTFTGTYSGNVANVPVGTSYAITSIFGELGDLAKQPTPDLPSSFNAGNLKTQTSVIPEPATAMLLAIGGGIAWLVRFKQRLS